MSRSLCLLSFLAGLACSLFPGSADAFDDWGHHRRGTYPPPPVYAYVPQTVRVVRYQPVTQSRTVVVQATAPTVHHHRRHHLRRSPATTTLRPTTQVKTTTRYRPVVQQVPTLVPIQMRPYSIPPKVRPGSGHPAFPYYGSTIRKMPNGTPIYYSF